MWASLVGLTGCYGRIAGPPGEVVVVADGPAGVDGFAVGGVSVVGEGLVAVHAVAGCWAFFVVVGPTEHGVVGGVADMPVGVSGGLFADDGCVAAAWGHDCTARWASSWWSTGWGRLRRWCSPAAMSLLR